MNIYNTLVGRGQPYLAELFSAALETTTMPTAAIMNGKMYINMEWFGDLTIRQMECVLKHEALHIALNHNIRCAKWGGNPTAFTVATDAHINEYLQELRALHGVFYDTLPDIGQDPRLLTTEQLATELEKVSNSLPDTHDMHDSVEGQPVDDTMRKTAKNIVNSLSDEEKGHIERAFDTILNSVTGFPEISDEEQRIMSLIGNAWLSPREPGYSRPSRRVSSSDFLLKGKARSFKKPIIDIYIDVSGSMADQAGKWVSFGSELCKKYGGQLRVSLWSDSVPKPSTVVPENFKSGGTNWKELEKTLNIERPSGHKTVVITDLCGCVEGQLIGANEVIRI